MTAPRRNRRLRLRRRCGPCGAPRRTSGWPSILQIKLYQIRQGSVHSSSTVNMPSPSCVMGYRDSPISSTQVRSVSVACAGSASSRITESERVVPVVTAPNGVRNCGRRLLCINLIVRSSSIESWPAGHGLYAQDVSISVVHRLYKQHPFTIGERLS